MTVVKEAGWEKKKTGEERKKKERKRKRGKEKEKEKKERRGENGLRLAGTQADLSVALSLVTVLLVLFFSSTAS